ncbi:glycosyltransferase family 4 protein [Sphingomonas sp. M1-B02]|uniref:glycosyltransferase family 4 protein n=1 Tax=Sphingomonas sp. M1-B02 TaxID=3114300 RepID=UPI00223EE97D|nr:glycosyltransferase family 4 protein [Sphingomonas sp. S6-11]UZK67728.1 glycosyltransferase family 4 protein [Sphingomonas sp. S6-11]
MALLAVARELARTGNVVTVMGSGPPRPDTPYAFKQVPSLRRERFERFPRIPPLRSDVAWEDATFALSLLRSYRPEDFDAVVTCSFPFTHWALRRPARSKPAQIFVTQNGDWPATSESAEYRTFRCDGLICTNPDFFERSRARWNCALIPNGVSPGAFSPAPSDRARFGLPEGPPLILMVSALIDSKRVIEGIHAVARVPGAHLVVAGDGALRNRVSEEANQHLPGRFTRLTVSAAEMPALYNSADVFLHMSLLESFGNVFVEAMACGLPIVGHDTPRLRWIVGDREQLCDTESPDALHQALERALSLEKGSPDDRVARFYWPQIAEQYHRFLSGIVGGC